MKEGCEYTVTEHAEVYCANHEIGFGRKGMMRGNERFWIYPGDRVLLRLIVQQQAEPRPVGYFMYLAASGDIHKGTEFSLPLKTAQNSMRSAGSDL